MNYQVWSKDEFGDTYNRVECEDIDTARRAIDKVVRTGGSPILTVEVPYSLAIKIEAVGSEKPTPTVDPRTKFKPDKEESKSEADQSETRPGESTGVKSSGQV